MQIKTIASSNGMNQNSYIVYSNNNIVLIDAGKVEGIGNHEELSKESSLYKEII